MFNKNTDLKVSSLKLEGAVGDIIVLNSRKDTITHKTCNVSITRKNKDTLDYLVDPPFFLETTEGRELLVDYLLILVQQIFEEDQRVKDTFVPD